jgi:hypothetical protein
MDQEALVDLALEDGARLDVELRRRGIALDTPIAAYDLSIEQWALLFGIPPQLSRRHVYEEMQSAISTLGLTLSLDQMVLVKNSDPGLRELKSVVPADQGRAWQSQSPPVEVGGRSFTLARSIRPGTLQYEDAVGEAFRSLLSADTSFQRGDSGLWPLRHHALEGRVRRRGPGIDFVATWDERVLLIEAKATRRPLAVSQVLSAFGQLSYYQRELEHSRTVALILVSMAGFTDAVKAEFENFADFLLVSWSIGQDREVIAEAIARLAQ